MAEFVRTSGDDAYDRIRVLFEKYGNSNYIGEPVSIIEHSLQAAYFTAKKHASDQELVIANLLHDVGHALGLEVHQEMEMDGCGVREHEKVGAEFLLKLGFPPRVAKLARAHVQAKRYLCFDREDYYANLSDASKITLGFQGGPMNGEEAEHFQSDPDFENILFMRECDEAGKIPHGEITVPNLESYRESIKFLVDCYVEAHPTERAARLSGYTLSDFQIASFKQNSFLKLENLLSFDHIPARNVGHWCEEISQWPKAEGKWLLHWEENKEGRKIMCRSENFVDYHKGMARLAQGCVLNVVSQLFQNPVEEKVLFFFCLQFLVCILPLRRRFL
jgi:putative nucleotidyltransferase with HDIG domain